MKFVSWNIRHGGGKQAEQIATQLEAWCPDVVGLSEFRETQPSQRIARALLEQGLKYQITTASASKRGVNFLMLAAREPLKSQPFHKTLDPTGRWLHVKIAGIQFVLMHVPNRGKAGDRKKLDFLTASAEVFRSIRRRKALAVGDTNSARPGIDCETNFFRPGCIEEAWFDRVESAGWIDLWRNQNPSTLDYTWFSHSGNGFRLDQAFASRTMDAKVEHVSHIWGQDQLGNRLSDHAAIHIATDL